MEDRGRQAVHLQALTPIAETTADPNSYGFRPKRRCADAIDQCFKILRQKTSATWIFEGDIAGFFDNIAFSWIERNIPMDKQLLSKWLRSGYMEEQAFYPTTQGVPQGGLISPVIGNMTLDGLENVVRGKSEWFRRQNNINFVRYADDFIITANNREVLIQLTPQIEAFLAERGVSLSKEKTKITHISEGIDFLGQNIRKHVCANGQLGKIQITPSKASFQYIKDKVRFLTKRYRGATPKELIQTNSTPYCAAGPTTISTSSVLRPLVSSTAMYGDDSIDGANVVTRTKPDAGLPNAIFSRDSRANGALATRTRTQA